MSNYSKFLELKTTSGPDSFSASETKDFGIDIKADSCFLVTHMLLIYSL